MVKDEGIKDLSRPEYWDQCRESKQGWQSDSCKWFRTFKNLRPFFEKHLPDASSGSCIMHLGCDNSVRPHLRHN